MSRLFRHKGEKQKSIWKRVVDLAFTDVRVAVGGLDHDSLEMIEERLIAADFGVSATLKLIDHLEGLTRRGKVRPQDLARALEERVTAILAAAEDRSLSLADAPPTVYLVVGVNGVGKTTSIGKMAYRFVQSGRSVLLGAGDTYRAGAIEQLSIWAGRAGAEFVGGQEGGDPASVAFDTIDAAQTRGIDVALIDTAGRLHTQSGLMAELRKIDRVVRRRLEGAPHETLMVLDATVGQNALQQVRAFAEVVALTGIVLAKADSSARGGIVVALQEEFGLPVKLVGTGEGIGDLEEFDPEAFAGALASA